MYTRWDLKINTLKITYNINSHIIIINFLALHNVQQYINKNLHL